MSITANQKQSEVIWEVIGDHTPPPKSQKVKEARDEHMQNIGYVGIDELLRSEKFKDPVSECNDSTSKIPYRPVKQSKCTVFAIMFLRLMFVNWHCSLDKFNGCVRKYNNNEPRKVKEFSKAEFLVGHAIMVGAAVFLMSGSRLWDMPNDEDGDEWDSMIQPPGFRQYMKLYRFKQFRTFIPMIYESKELEDSDPWWRFKSAIDAFNYIRSVSSYVLFVFNV